MEHTEATLSSIHSAGAGWLHLKGWRAVAAWWLGTGIRTRYSLPGRSYFLPRRWRRRSDDCDRRGRSLARNYLSKTCGECRTGLESFFIPGHFVLHLPSVMRVTSVTKGSCLLAFLEFSTIKGRAFSHSPVAICSHTCESENSRESYIL